MIDLSVPPGKLGFCRQIINPLFYHFGFIKSSGFGFLRGNFVTFLEGLGLRHSLFGDVLKNSHSQISIILRF